MKPNPALSLALAVTMTLSSCSVYRVVDPPSRTDAPTTATRFTKFARPPGQKVAGYTTTDGRWHEFDGRAFAEGDSMTFHRPARDRERMMPQEPATQVRVALHDLASVRSEATDPERTTLFVVGMGALAALFYVMGSLASWNGLWGR